MNLRIHLLRKLNPPPIMPQTIDCIPLVCACCFARPAGRRLHVCELCGGACSSPACRGTFWSWSA